MPQQRASFEWTLEAQVKQGESTTQIINDAKTIMSQQTVKTFTDEMAKRGVSDYKFRSVETTAELESGPKLRPRLYGTGLAGVQYIAKIKGKTIIEFDDVPVAIAAIIAAIAVAITAHAGLIVLVGIIAIIAIIAVTLTHIVITDITSGIATTGEAINRATSTTGGSAITIGIALVVILGVIIAGITLVPRLVRQVKEKYL